MIMHKFVYAGRTKTGGRSYTLSKGFGLKEAKKEVTAQVKRLCAEYKLRDISYLVADKARDFFLGQITLDQLEVSVRNFVERSGQSDTSQSSKIAKEIRSIVESALSKIGRGHDIHQLSQALLSGEDVWFALNDALLEHGFDALAAHGSNGSATTRRVVAAAILGDGHKLAFIRNAKAREDAKRARQL